MWALTFFRFAKNGVFTDSVFFLNKEFFAEKICP